MTRQAARARIGAIGRSWPIRPIRADEPELLDRPGHDPALVAGNLADLGRVNRWLGGVRLTIQALDRLTRELNPGDDLTIVDLATGGADIPAAIAAWARRRGLRAWILATDISLDILSLAPGDGPGRECPAPAGPVQTTRTPERPACRDSAAVQLAVADARCLPFTDRGFDVAICSLALHHLSPDEAVSMLAEMRRVARRGVIVNDLVRNWLGFLGAWVLGHTLTRNPLTRHDAPLSARRAYTRAEMIALARRAGLRPVTFDGFLGYRVAMTAVVTECWVLSTEC